MRSFLPISAGLVVCTFLTGQVSSAQWAAVPPAVDPGYTAYGHGHGYFGGLNVGYGQSSFSEPACMAPEYGMEDVGSDCNHWRNRCCDNAWAGYCGEHGLLGRRTSSSACCDSPSDCPRGCRLFSLFRWSRPAEAYTTADECSTEADDDLEQETPPAEAVPETAPVESASLILPQPTE